MIIFTSVVLPNGLSLLAILCFATWCPTCLQHIPFPLKLSWPSILLVSLTTVCSGFMSISSMPLSSLTSPRLCPTCLSFMLLISSLVSLLLHPRTMASLKTSSVNPYLLLWRFNLILMFSLWILERKLSVSLAIHLMMYPAPSLSLLLNGPWELMLFLLPSVVNLTFYLPLLRGDTTGSGLRLLLLVSSMLTLSLGTILPLRFHLRPLCLLWLTLWPSSFSLETMFLVLTWLCPRFMRLLLVNNSILLLLMLLSSLYIPLLWYTRRTFLISTWNTMMKFISKRCYQTLSYFVSMVCDLLLYWS